MRHPPFPNHISIYIHIPFCSKKCAYCHFYVLPNKEELKLAFLEALKIEIQKQASQLSDKKLVSLYFGGGTPSLLGPERIGNLILEIKNRISLLPECEITLEANPEFITRQDMEEYKLRGINRVSFGVQTLDNPLLIKLGRQHEASTALEAIHYTNAAGISNISIDLMYDIPGQTLNSWSQTLEHVRDLPIKHLSLYNLTIEPHTLFFKQQNQLKKEIPDPETSTQMYQEAVLRLEESGLMRYEISAFAKEGYYSRHNTGYWLGRPFLGFGPSAFSYWEGKRFRNIAHLKKYCQALENGESPVDFTEELSPASRRRELLTIAIRLKEGVDLVDFQNDHGMLDPETVSTLLILEKTGFLYKSKNSYRLSDKGTLFYDSVASELV